MINFCESRVRERASESQKLGPFTLKTWKKTGLENKFFNKIMKLKKQQQFSE